MINLYSNPENNRRFPLNYLRSKVFLCLEDPKECSLTGKLVTIKYNSRYHTHLVEYIPKALRHQYTPGRGIHKIQPNQMLRCQLYNKENFPELFL